MESLEFYPTTIKTVFDLLALICAIPTAFLAFKTRFIENYKAQCLDLLKNKSLNNRKQIKIDYRIIAFLMFRIDGEIDWLHIFDSESEISKRIDLDKSDSIRGLIWFALFFIFAFLSISSEFTPKSYFFQIWEPIVNNQKFLGLFVATILGQLIIWIIIDKGLRNKNPRTSEFAYTWLLGIIERILYFISISIGLPQWITFWITAKIAITWHVELVKKGIHEKDSYNIFMIGNGLSVLFALLGVWIAFGYTFPPFQKSQ